MPRRGGRAGVDRRNRLQPRTLVELLHSASQAWGTTVRLALLLFLIVAFVAALSIVLIAAYGGDFPAVVSAGKSRW